MSDKDVGAWNDGQYGRTTRQKDALLRRIRFQDGCWMWTGETNFAGSPIVRHGGDVVSAGQVVHNVWRGRNPSPTARKVCGRDLCVNPDCLVEPGRA